MQLLRYEDLIFFQDFVVYGLVPAAIFGIEQSVLKAVFFSRFFENVERHLIKFFR
jgi:hypothetical protein